MNPTRQTPGSRPNLGRLLLLILPLVVCHQGWTGSPLAEDVIFVSRQFRGTAGRYYERPFESVPDTESNLFKYTASGELVQLTDLGSYDGGAIDPCLSWDANRVLFAMRRHVWDGWHIWEMNVDGSDLRQVTFDPPGGKSNDRDPVYLSTPGTFAFVSDRRGGMDESGQGGVSNLFVGDLATGQVRPVGYNPSGEAGPIVDDTGHLLYSRWENLRDNRRGAVWKMRQDGTGTTARWAQYGTPAGAVVAAYDLTQIAGGASPQFLGIFTGFERTYGDLGRFTMTDYMRDPERNPTRLPQDGRYQTPYALDADTILYSFDPYEPEGQSNREDFGIYLDTPEGDSRALVFNATETHEMNPILVRPRTPPPVTGGSWTPGDPTGLFVCADVTLRGDCRQPCALTPGLGDPVLPQHLSLSAVDKVRVFRSMPRRGAGFDVTLSGPDLEQIAGKEAVVGEVPVASDGSIAIEIPSGEPFAFQILDSDGAAIAQEKSWLSTQPGETVNCAGCHVPRNGVAYQDRNSGEPAALLSTALLSGVPTRTRDYLSDIRPLFMAKCASCHGGGSPSGGLDLSSGADSYRELVRVENSRVPNRYAMNGSARNSFLFQILSGDAYGQSDHQNLIASINAIANHTSFLSAEEEAAVAEWLDTGTAFAHLPEGVVDAPLRVQMTAPADGTNNLPLNTAYEIVFTEPIDPAKEVASLFSVAPDGGGPVAGAVSFPAPHVLRFVPDAALQPGTAYYINLATGVEDLQGDTMVTPFSASFITGLGSDTSAPTASWAEPNGTLQHLPITGPILVGFSEQMSPGSLRADRFHLTDSHGNEHSLIVRVRRDRRSVSLAPYPALEPDSDYALVIDADARDLCLNSLTAPVAMTFRTAPHLPVSALTLREEMYNRQYYDYDGQDLLFTKNDHWTVHLDWERSRLRWFWNASREELGSTPVSNRPISMTQNNAGTLAYVLTREGKTMQILDIPSQSVIQTVELPTTRGLEIRLTPDDTKAVIVSRDPTRLYVVDVNPASPSYLQVLGDAEGTNHDRARTWLNLHPDGANAYVTGSRGLDHFQFIAGQPRFVNRLLGSWYLGDAVLSQGGKQLYIINRSRGTVAVFDTVSEKVVAEVALDFGPEWSWEIADDRIDLSPDERWIVVTQENKGTVWVLDRHNLKLIDRMEIGEQISAMRTRANGAGWEIHLLLRDRYRDRSRWLILEGPRGLDGGAPLLSSTDPLQGAGNVAVNRTLTLQFSEPMDRHTLNEDNITVSCNTCEEPEVAIDVTIEKNNRVAHLICEGTWPIQANLSASLGIGVRDLTGQPLANPLSFSFNTAGNAAPPYVALISDFSQVGSDASHVAVDPLGRWILTNDYYGDDLYIHDQRTHEFVTRLDTADGPADILCPPGTNKAYIANHLQGTLSVLDLGDLVYVGTIPVDTNPNHMALSRDGKVLNVVCSASDTVVQVDIATDQVLGRLPAPEGTDLATVETGKKVDWVAAGWNSLELFDTSGARTYEVPNGGGARIVQMLASSDGYQLFLLEQWRSQQYVMDTVTWTRTDTLPSPTIASKLLESPDQRFLLAAYREEGLIRIRDRLTTETVGVVEGVGDVYDMAFSGDGKKLFVLRRGNPGRVLIFSWSDGTDIASPFVSAVDPWDGATVVPANTVVRVRFSEPVDRRTVSEENLWVAGGTIPPVHAEVSLSRDNLTALIVPEIPFEVGTSFTVNVSQQVRDLSGNPLVPAYNSDFQTAFQANPAPALLFSGTSDVIGSPYYIAPLVDGDPVLVANYHSNALTLHHPVTLQQGFSINREKRTGRVLPFDGNRAWVNYPENREISLINVTNGLAEDTVVYSRERRAEAMSADRSRLALAIGGDPAYLYVLDLGNDGATSTREFEIWDWPRSLALSPDGRYAYVAYWSDILVINLETQIIERRLFGSDMQSIVIDPSGRLLYVAENNRDRVRVMDIETGATLTTLPVGQGEWSVVPSRQGDIVAILCRGEGTIRFYDGYTNGLLQVYQHVQGETLRAAEFSPDGDRFYFTWDSSARDGVTALSLVNRRTSPPPSPTPTVTPAVTPTPTPNPSQQPGNPFDVVVDGLVDEHDLLMLMEMGTMQGGEPAEPGLFMFSLYWHQ